MEYEVKLFFCAKEDFFVETDNEDEVLEIAQEKLYDKYKSADFRIFELIDAYDIK